MEASGNDGGNDSSDVDPVEQPLDLDIGSLNEESLKYIVLIVSLNFDGGRGARKFKRTLKSKILRYVSHNANIHLCDEMKQCVLNLLKQMTDFLQDLGVVLIT